MAEPTSGLSFTELIRRVANKAGVAYFGSSGDQSALIPVDAYNLGLCKDIVRDAFRMFVSDCPKRGWRWQKRLMSVALTATRITGTADSASTTTIVDLTLADTYDYLHYVGTCTASEFSVGETVTQDTSGATGLITAITATTLDITVVSGTADKTNNWTHGAHTFTTSSAVFPLEGYYCYITGGTGKGSWAVITDYNALTGAITVADWLDQYGNAAGTDPVADSTFAVTPVETVGGDISRYPLPESFGGEVAGPIDYAASTAHATPIEWRDESFIRANRVPTVTTGYPHYVCIRPLEPAIADIADGSTKRRFELILDPQPSAADTLEFPYLAHFDNLDVETGTGDSGSNTTIVDELRKEGDDYFIGWRIDIISGTGKGSWAIVDDYHGTTGTFDVPDWLKANGDDDGTNPGDSSAYTVQPVNNFHPAGFRNDEFILAACYAKLAMEDEETDPALEQRYIQKVLPKAYQADARLAPRALGSMNVTGRRLGRIRNNVTTEHDV